ncbi:competence/damage-inducible protein A [Fluviicola taffensis]|uniref:CinA-like protein n=1 Tax=Fluviicola taffensis (strain DSM 16823 / NCIMB 13979 / RW262) TaxID=755732 RepID=F2IG42_FLUTR|nr:competence/damage-inducible protein A [Fluviicola taffensis]AEA44677.1 competence/damage-inducible protein CinA [Fluviicola taffensis DSM 16823]
MINVEIISIGDELLIGQTINTNASWMGVQLAIQGIKVANVVTISDTWDAISHALKVSQERSQVVLITGGLGPTKDDITKQVLCDFFNTKLVLNQDVLEHVESFFIKRNRPMLEVNKMQAMIPEACEVLFNEQGTAPGMWFENSDTIFVSMPGVPYEMKYLFETHVIPRLTNRFPVKKLIQKTYLTQGIGESFLAERLIDWENELRAEGLDLAYLPSPGMVKLRVSSSSGNLNRVAFYGNQLNEMIPTHLYGEEEETLPEVVGKLLLKNGQTIGAVESCTGGNILASLTSVSGSSGYVLGGFVTYSNELKIKLSKVKSETLTNFGAVSEEVVLEMATGGKSELGVDWSISVSGVAGPLGGSEDKPVGTVWIAIDGPIRKISRKFLFGTDRQRTVQMTVLTALNMLRCEILGINIEKKHD